MSQINSLGDAVQSVGKSTERVQEAQDERRRRRRGAQPSPEPVEAPEPPQLAATEPTPTDTKAADDDSRLDIKA